MSTEIRWKYDILGLIDRPKGEPKWRVVERPAFPSKPALFKSDDIEACKDWIEEREKEGGYAVVFAEG